MTILETVLSILFYEVAAAVAVLSGLFLAVWLWLSDGPVLTTNRSVVRDEESE